MIDGKITLYHDGSCPLCRREIDHYRRQRGADGLAFVDVSDCGAVVGPDLDRRAAMARFHVRMPDGTLRSGAAGFLAVWRQLPRWRWLVGLARVPGVLALLEAGYRLSLPVRPVLARAVTRFGRTRGRAHP